MSMCTITGTIRSTPLPWLPDLSNIPPPHLRQLEATAKQLTKVQTNDKLPLNTDITLHPAARLSSRKPVWLDPPAESMTANSAWSDEWAATDVVNHSLVTEPLVCPPGFDLSWQHWSMLNRFRMGQGRCAVNLFRWGQATYPYSSCGEPEHCQRVSVDSFQRRTRGSTPGWTRCCFVAGHEMQTLRRRSSICNILLKY